MYSQKWHTGILTGGGVPWAPDPSIDIQYLLNYTITTMIKFDFYASQCVIMLYINI